MSRSGYSDEEAEPGQFAMWRGQVASAIRGRRGQALLREMLAAMDAMPVKRLIANSLREGRGIQVHTVWDPEAPSRWGPYKGEFRTETITHCAAATYQGGLLLEVSVCALGTVGEARGIPMENLNPEAPNQVARAFDIAHQLASEIAYMNDEYGAHDETPEHRWVRMRAWAASNIKADAPG